jgi:septation ring formation regulator EzrA
MSDVSKEARKFAERVERDRERYREYKRNQSTYEGDWGELVTSLNEMMK